jgi:hypothetical protein
VHGLGSAGTRAEFTAANAAFFADSRKSNQLFR